MTYKPEVMSGESLDIAAQRRDELKQHFPGVFTETQDADGNVVSSIDFERLKAELGTFSDIYEGRRERYGMEWPGKRDCMKVIQEPSRATLKPCPDESVDWDTTKNLFIEGDNLEVLKLLQKSYYGKVKMIYIDPPYNTGNEFIYPDNYQETLDTYLAYAGLLDDEGKKFTTNTASEGRYHTKWLNMMFPRLFTAKNLLRDDGIIVISIDDNEVTNLRNLCNDIFGEENYAATLVWDRNRKNDAKYFSVGHEYMLVYFKNAGYLQEQGKIFRAPKEGVDELRELFEEWRVKNDENWDSVREELLNFYSTISDDDPRKPIKRFRKVDENGPYRDDGNINWPGGNGPKYEILHPKTKRPCKLPTSGWRYPNSLRFWEEFDKGRIVFGPDETTVPRIRTNLFENQDQVMTSVHYSYAQTATNEFVELFNGNRVFDNPKPVSDLFQLVRYLTEDEDIVMDFFAGSATTAHATMKINAQNGEKRKFILVQLPEKCDENSTPYSLGYKKISDISADRIRKAAKRLSEDFPQSNFDMGFRYFKLSESNFKGWKATQEENVSQLQIALELAVNNVVVDASQTDILYEILLKAGFEPTESIQKLVLCGKCVFSVAHDALLICLEDQLTAELIDAVIALEPMQFICLDKGFQGNDQLKANTAQAFKARSQDSEAEMVFKVV
ncbi:site-specific DNA-methyltransferase [Vibrio cholerae]